MSKWIENRKALQAERNKAEEYQVITELLERVSILERRFEAFVRLLPNPAKLEELDSESFAEELTE